MTGFFSTVASHRGLSWAVGGAIAVVFLIGGWQTYRVNQAHEASVAAEIEAAKAQATADAKQQALEDVTRATTAQLEASKQLISKMQEEISASRVREQRAVQARDQILQQRAQDFSQVRSETDVDLATAIEKLAAEVYPEDKRLRQVSVTSDGWVLNRAAAETFDLSLLDVRSRRQSEEQLQQVADERATRIKNLEAVLEQKDATLSALEKRITALESSHQALMDSNTAYQRHIEALEAEVKALQKKGFWQSWKGRAVNIGLLVAGVAIGQAVN